MIFPLNRSFLFRGKLILVKCMGERTVQMDQDKEERK